MKRLPLGKILEMPAGPGKTAALAEWVQKLFGPEDPIPVLVGGSALELFTGGAYVTGDLDFVGKVPAHVRDVLAASGFIRKGRHWIHGKGRIFLEFPSSALGANETAQYRHFHNHSVFVISPEDLLVDRLSAWVHWDSGLDGVNAFLLYRALADQLDRKRLKKNCLEAEVSGALAAVRALFRRHGGEIPDGEVMRKWATGSLPQVKGR